MEQLIQSNNICTVGWTNIHAWMSPKDMRYLKRQCPSGFFQCNTVYKEGITRFKDQLKAVSDSYGGKAGVYFNFKLDARGKRLLKQLGLNPNPKPGWSQAEE